MISDIHLKIPKKKSKFIFPFLYHALLRKGDCEYIVTPSCGKLFYGMVIGYMFYTFGCCFYTHTF